MSCSSEMSPTISSRMSSSVTRPFDLAVFVDHQREVGLAPAERLELLRQRTDVGHEPGRQRDRHDVDLGKVAFGVLQRAQQVLGVQDADDVLGLVAPQRDAGELGLEHRADDLFRRIVGIDRHHLGAMDHDVGNFEVAEAENVLDVFRLALFHLAVLGRHLDEPLDLDVGEDFLLRAFLDAEHPQDRARRGIEQPVQRIEEQKGDDRADTRSIATPAPAPGSPASSAPARRRRYAARRTPGTRP